MSWTTENLCQVCQRPTRQQIVTHCGHLLCLACTAAMFHLCVVKWPNETAVGPSIAWDDWAGPQESCKPAVRCSCGAKLSRDRCVPQFRVISDTRWKLAENADATEMDQCIRCGAALAGLFGVQHFLACTRGMQRCPVCLTVWKEPKHMLEHVRACPATLSCRLCLKSQQPAKWAAHTRPHLTAYRLALENLGACIPSLETAQAVLKLSMQCDESE